MDGSFVKQLIIGAASSTTDQNGFGLANCSITLVKHQNLVILVDCGSPWDGKMLLDALSAENLTPSDVTHVICTHGHVDHAGNLNYFQNATIVLEGDVGKAPNLYKENTFEPLTCDIELLSTPGHTAQDVSLVVKNVKDYGTVVVAGDVFESENDEESWRDYSMYPEQQMKSREKILNMANWIVPGHGKMFRNNRGKQ